MILTELLCACQNLGHTSMQHQVGHVKGHQDSSHPAALSCEAWLNIEADLAAMNCISPTPLVMVPHRLPFEPWLLMIGNKNSETS